VMRYLKFGFLAILGIVLIALALANREMVTLRLLTDDAANLLGVQNQITLPLFAVIFAALVGGILVGLVWEWFREYQYRAEATRKSREADALRRDLAQVKPEAGNPGDDVLALLNGGSKA